ncbi:MAG: hypothetical protein WBY94_30135 [Polyangiaceae bacterium]
MPSHEFRAVHLPYCLQRLDDGRYVVLNRDYKPLGFRTREHITYENYPIAVKLAGLTKKLAAKLSCEGSDELAKIFLYNDSTVPTKDAKSMTAYLGRLAVLAKLKIAPEQ